LQGRRGREGKVWEKKTRLGTSWVELLVRIYGLLHNRSRAVSRTGEISAAKTHWDVGVGRHGLSLPRGEAERRLAAGRRKEY
jgi:hypothetical protein